MLEKIHNLSGPRGPGRGIEPGQIARVLSGPKANRTVRVRALRAPDVAEVEETDE